VRPRPRPAAHPGSPTPSPRRISGRLIAGLAAGLVLLGGALYLAIPGSPAPSLPGGAHRADAAAGFRGSLVEPARPAPATVLPDERGVRTDLAGYRGRALLVTFLYTHCPDVCPLIAAHLRAAQARLGPEAGRVALVAISVDPRGDTRRSAAEFLRAHALTGRMRYLLGTPRQLGRVWAAWNVGSERDAGHPELVAHSALVYGVGASGRLETIYPPTFDPADVVHDVPLLAAR
jgi:protein SCO1/2